MFSAAFLWEPGNYDAEFNELNAIIESAATSIPGYLGVECWASEDGTRKNATYYWDSLESLKALSTHPKHLEAKRRYSEWYKGSPVVERVFAARSADGREWEMQVRLWAPKPAKLAPWSCDLEITELHSPPKPLYGVDSWQSLQLALEFAASMLQHFQSQGGTLRWPHDESDQDREEVQVQDLFPRLRT
jgi:heme-degrading monooxygenase HmoA